MRIRRLCKHCLLSHLLFPPLLLQTPFAPESKISNCGMPWGHLLLTRCCAAASNPLLNRERIGTAFDATGRIIGCRH